MPVVFFSLWALMFILYFPAAKAGFVTDFTGWLNQVKNHGFWEYINRSNFKATSLYQVTQFNTYIFYKLFFFCLLNCVILFPSFSRRESRQHIIGYFMISDSFCFPVEFECGI